MCRGIAMSDLHLDFKAGSATEGGLNVRMLDVERAWEHAVRLTIEADPDLVTIAGDVLHQANSGTIVRSMVALQNGIRRIVQETGAIVVVIPGNHEGTRTVEALTPVQILDGMHDRVVVVTDVEQLRLRLPRTGESVALWCFPFGVLNERRDVVTEPDPSVDLNMMLIHAAVRSSTATNPLPGFYAGDTAVDVGPLAEQFDVIAAGDFHQYRRLHPSRLAFYSGSIEHTSTDIWKDADVPKGVVLYDTAAGTMELLEIPTRRVVDLSFADISPDETAGCHSLNIALTLLAEEADLRDAIVRLVVEDFPREDRARIDRNALHQLQRHCLQFRLDLRLRAEESVEAAAARTEMSSSVIGQAQSFFAPDPAPVRECSVGYLQLAGAA